MRHALIESLQANNAIERTEFVEITDTKSKIQDSRSRVPEMNLKGVIERSTSKDDSSRMELEAERTWIVPTKSVEFGLQALASDRHAYRRRAMGQKELVNDFRKFGHLLINGI